MAQSIVDDQGAYKTTCGYCKSGTRNSVSHGMYAQQLTVDDYQALINRGWRRSGNFLYKPAMERTCCPPYTIRLDVNDFVPSKEQKAVLRKMERYLNGDLELNEAPAEGPAIRSKPFEGEKTKGAKPTQQSVRRGKRDREIPSLLGNGQRATPGESTGSGGSEQAASRGSAKSGGEGDADAKPREGRSSGGTGREGVGLSALSPSPMSPNPLQPDKPAKSPEPSRLDQIKVLVQQCVAHLMGGPCPVPVAAKEVPQKVQKKLEKRKQGERAACETMYSSNIAFVLAASRKKGGASIGPKVANQQEGKLTSSASADAMAGSSAKDEGAEGRPRFGDSNPAAIADALAAELRGRQIGAGEWRVEACGGHLNFYTPAAQMGDGETGSITGSGSREAGSEDEAARALHEETQPKRRKRFEMRMSRAKFDKEEYLLYRKYQIRVHNDAPHDVTESSYRRFLVDSPLKASTVPSAAPGNDDTGFGGFGSFHQQYRIDGRLIAVGVVDVLPQCLSSKYLFWDPDLAPLSLGKFTALKEIEWVRNAQRRAPTLHYYYLGYYIHNCAKMRYKAAYSPSQLLCPLHYSWQPHNVARHILDRRPFADLCHTADTVDRADEAKSQGAAGPANGEQPGEMQARQRGQIGGVTSSDVLVAGKADGQSIGRAGSEKGAGSGSPQSRGERLVDDDRELMHQGGATGGTDAGSEGAGSEQDHLEGSPVDVDERDQGMLDSDVIDGFSGDESEVSESASEMDADVESSGREGSAPASAEELGEVPLMLGGTVIPFRFFQQLGMLPPAAVRLLLSRLRPYHVAVGPELANRLVYSLG